jgi:hypothetical protein
MATKITKTTTTLTITQFQKGWTRWGGGHDYQKRDEDEQWACQACGENQPSQISPQLFPLYEGELVRICGLCQNTVNKFKIKDFYTLISKTRNR